MMMKAKNRTSRNQAHTPKSPRGMGDYYGTGVRQNVGTVKRSYLTDVIPPKSLKKPPKSLA